MRFNPFLLFWIAVIGWIAYHLWKERRASRRWDREWIAPIRPRQLPLETRRPRKPSRRSREDRADTGADDASSLRLDANPYGSYSSYSGHGSGMHSHSHAGSDHCHHHGSSDTGSSDSGGGGGDGGSGGGGCD